MASSGRWFSEGALIFRRMDLAGLFGATQLPEDGEYYPCPSCKTAYSRDEIAELTREDVPPKSQGGKVMLLTCASCNHAAGKYFDAHAARRSVIHNLAMGRDPRREVRAEFDAGGAVIRGYVSHGPQGVIMRGVPDQNSNEQVAAHVRELDQMWDGGSDPVFTVKATEKFVAWRAAVSWVRAAYLASFAALGWSYAFRPELDPVRHQLMNPDSESLPRLALIDLNAPSERRGMLLVKTPEELRSLLVVIGHYSILLPGVTDPLSCQELSDAISQWSRPGSPANATLKGDTVPWPTQPEYAMDEWLLDLLNRGEGSQEPDC